LEKLQIDVATHFEALVQYCHNQEEIIFDRNNHRDAPINFFLTVTRLSNYVTATIVAAIKPVHEAHLNRVSRCALLDY
jgi:hypothetical protein